MAGRRAYGTKKSLPKLARRRSAHPGSKAILKTVRSKRRVARRIAR